MTKINAKHEVILRKIDFEFHGFECYKINPAMFSIPGRYQGFDIYLCGDFKREYKSKTDIIVCYNKLGHRQYQQVNIYTLSDSDETECWFVAGYFERFYLRKRCHLKILTPLTNMADAATTLS